jgi:importin subunit beta-1
VNDQARGQIKNYVLQALLSRDLKAATAAGQVIAAIAVIELPLGQWGNLIETLLMNVANPQNAAHVKQSTLQAIGFVCEEMVCPD